MNENLEGVVYSCVYTACIIVFGSLYKILSFKHTVAENHRYQKQYDDALVGRLFWANFVNFYMPFFL